MFLLNSCLGQFSAATFVALLLPKLRSHFAEFLNNASPVGLGILTLPTCVGLRYGHGTNNSGFSWQPVHTLPYSWFGPRHASGLREGFSSPAPPALAPGSPSPVVLPFCVPTVLLYRGAGISACCPSATPLGLALGPDFPRADQLYPGNLGHPAGRIPTFLSLLIPAFSLPCSPRLLPVPLPPACTAPLPIYIPIFLSCVGVFQPRTFSAQDHSTSELLRTLLMHGCF